MVISQEAREKGIKAENKFQEWLESKKLPYLYVKQTLDSMPTLFKEQGIKRPDFFILIPNIGMIAVDVKCIKLTGKNRDYYFNVYNEVFPLLHFEQNFRMPTWFAITYDDSMAFKTWRWIPVSSVAQYKITDTVNGECYFVPPQNCIEVSFNEGIGKLFNL